MNARYLLMKKLEEIGSDGLCNPELECGCGLDDFEPCGECVLAECEPATLNKEDGLYYTMEQEAKQE